MVGAMEDTSSPIALGIETWTGRARLSPMTRDDKTKRRRRGLAARYEASPSSIRPSLAYVSLRLAVCAAYPCIYLSIRPSASPAPRPPADIQNNSLNAKTYAKILLR